MGDLVILFTVIVVIGSIIAGIKDSKKKKDLQRNTDNNPPQQTIRQTVQRPVQQTAGQPVVNRHVQPQIKQPIRPENRQVMSQPVRNIQPPRFNDLHEAADYLRKCESLLQTDIEFCLPETYVRNHGERWLFDEIAYIMVYIWTLSVDTRKAPVNGYIPVVLNVVYRPGFVIIDTIRKSGISALTDEQRSLYAAADRIVAECRKKAHSKLELEKLLHDRLSDNAMYANSEDKDERNIAVSAYGALIDGAANCQGFSDAFYLLASLAGFNVAIVAGNTKKAPHAWNAIELDGNWYYIDVTFNQIENFGNYEDTNYYCKFNVANDIAKHEYFLRDYPGALRIAEHTAPQHDFYLCGLPGFGIAADNLPDAGRLIVEHFNRNNNLTHVRLNGITTDGQELSSHIKRYAKYNTAIKSWNIISANRQSNTYLVVFWDRA